MPESKTRAVAVALLTLVTVLGSTVAVGGAAGLSAGGGPVVDQSTDGGVAAPGSIEVTAPTGYRPNASGPTDGPNVSVDWEVVPDGETSGAVTAGGRVHVGTSGAGNSLYAYDAATGESVWEFSLDNRDGANFPVQPVVEDGRVYALAHGRFGNPNTLYAVDAADGTQLWQQAVTDGTTRPVADGGRVYYETDDLVVAREGDSGTEVWNRSLAGGISRPAVAGGVVYVGTSRRFDPGNLTALSAADGSVEWREPGNTGTVAADDGAVYAVRNEDGEVVAREAGGSVRWNYSLSADSATDVWTDDSRVYLGTSGATGVTAVDAADGTQAWRTTTAGQVSGEPIVTSDALYVGTDAGRVRALTPSTGALVWSRLYDDAVGGPAAAGGRLFVGGSPSLRAYADTGSRLPDPAETAGDNGFEPNATGLPDGPNVSVDWETTPGGRTTGAVVAGGTAYVTTAGDGNSLYAYDLESGTVEWEFSLDNRDGTNIGTRPVVVGGTVYVVSEGRFGGQVALYAVEADTGTQRWQTSVVDSTARPVASDGAVYLARDGRLRALDAATGSQQWRFELETGVQGPPVVSGGRVFVGTGRRFDPGFTYAVNAETGGGLWKVQDGDVRSVAAGNGSVYAAGSGEVVAREAATGDVRWRHSSSANTYDRLSLDGSRVYAATSDATGVSALDRTGGTLVWRRSLDELAGRARVTSDGVYVGTTTGRVSALARGDGSVRWTRLYDAAVAPAVGGDRVVLTGSPSLRTYTDTGVRLPDPAETAGDNGFEPNATGLSDGPNVSVDWEVTPGGSTTAATIADGTVYVGTGGDGDSLYAYDLGSGTVEWEFSLDDRDGTNVGTRPVVVGGTVYVVSEGRFGGQVALYAVEADTGTQRWQTSVADSTARPVASDGTVYLARDSLVRALDAATGSQQWRFELEGSVQGPPVVDDGRLFVGTGRRFDPGFTYAVNAETGGGLWKVQDGDVRNVAAGNGSVYAAGNGEVVAREAATGDVRWRHGSSAGGFADLSLDSGTVYATTRNAPGVSALDRAGGTLAWRQPTDAPTDRVRVTGDGVYVGTTTGRVSALARGDGSVRWTRLYDAAVAPAVGGDRVVLGGSPSLRTYADTGARLPDPSETAGADGYDPTSVGPTEDATVTVAWNRTSGAGGSTAPVTAGGRVFVGTSDGDDAVYAYDLESGDRLWNFSLDDRDGTNVGTRPVVAGGTVYVVSEGRFGGQVALYAVDADTGTQRWQTSVADSTARPVASDGTVYLARDSLVRALDAATGSQRWRFELRGNVRGPPVVDDGRLFVGTARRFDPGFTYAVNAETGGGLWKVQDGDVRGLAATDATVYVAKGDEVVARGTAAGDVRWRHDGSASTFTAVSTDGDRAYVATEGTTGVTALAADTGVPTWRQSTTGAVAGRVRLTLGGAYLGTSDGSVLAVNRSTGDRLWTRTVGGSATGVDVAGTRLVVSDGAGSALAYNGTGTARAIPPTATVTASATSVAPNETVTLEATATDVDGSVMSIEWDFDGDGTADATGASVSTSFEAAGIYDVTATVADDDGLTASATVTVTVEPANPFPNGVPGTGQTTPPTDPDTDGLYEDVDGDGSVAFDDVITLAFADFASVNADADQRAAVDFDGDGSFTFGDVIQLAFQL